MKSGTIKEIFHSLGSFSHTRKFSKTYLLDQENFSQTRNFSAKETFSLIKEIFQGSFPQTNIFLD